MGKAEQDEALPHCKKWGGAVALTQRTPARPPLGSGTSCCLQGWGEQKVRGGIWGCPGQQEGAEMAPKGLL